jgi:glycosyltransferase involved in cell wall biosynthesis
MRIVIVNDYAHINGGAAKVALQSAIELTKKGYKVDLFTGAGQPKPQLGKMGIHSTCLDQLPYNHDPRIIRAAFRGIWNREAAQRLQELLSKFDREDTIVHFHTFRDVLSTSVVKAAHLMGFTTVYTAHEYTLGCPYGGFFDFRKNRICKLTGLSAKCFVHHCNTGSYPKKLWNFANQFIYAKIARIPSSFSHIIFLSDTSWRVLHDYVPANQRISFVSNPFDPMLGKPASVDSLSPFLFVGNFAPHKDPLTAAKAAKKLGASMVFVGAGQLEEEIRRINPDAEITGWLDRDAIAKRMASARAIVFPSIWHESQPLTVMEAAASGLVTIAADASAAKEQVELLGAGEIFRSGDVDDLAAKMRPYCSDRHAQERGRAVFAAFQKFVLSEKQHVDHLLAIYEEELARRKP